MGRELVAAAVPDAGFGSGVPGVVPWAHQPLSWRAEVSSVRSSSQTDGGGAGECTRAVRRRVRRARGVAKVSAFAQRRRAVKG